MTSRPMPSPGSTSSFLFDAMTVLVFAAALGPEPGLAEPALFFERGDSSGLLQGQPNVVEPVQQALLAEGIDVELDDAAVGAGDRLVGEVDAEPRIGALARIVHQLVDDGLRQLDRQDAVLAAAVVGDGGGTRG